MKMRSNLAVVLLAAIAPVTAQAADQGGYSVEFIWKYQAHAVRNLKGDAGGEGDGPRMVASRADIRIGAEVRGTIGYTGALQGAAFVNQEDGRNDQRYDAWRADRDTARVESAVADMAVQITTATKLNLAEGEGYDTINKQNAGLIGRVRHETIRHEVRADVPEHFHLDGGDMQIDRVTDKLRIEGGGIELKIKNDAVTPTTSSIRRMDKPAPEGQWDSRELDADAWRVLPAIKAFDLEFDVPPGAEEFTVTRTRDAQTLRDPFDYNLGSDWRDDDPATGKLKGKTHEATETLTLIFRRIKPAERAAASKAASAAASSAPAAPAPEAPAPPAAETAEKAKDAVKKLRGLLKF